MSFKKKDKSINSIGPDSGSRPQRSQPGSLLCLAGHKNVAAHQVSPTQGQKQPRPAQANAGGGRTLELVTVPRARVVAQRRMQCNEPDGERTRGLWRVRWAMIQGRDQCLKIRAEQKIQRWSIPLIFRKFGKIQ
jgi:hypothetical protein